MSSLPSVNYLSVLAAGVAIFLLGGLWYSPLLFAKRWVGLMGKSEAELKQAAPGPLPYVMVFVCGVLTAYALAIVLNHFGPATLTRTLLIAILMWIGFAGATSFGSAMFSGTPRLLWLINSGYNLVAFIVAALILAFWR
ncbi:MAG: DUF1761 domain-containing protein [Acidobacteria bacterium]|nr:DUF1761 domain-containing protein [Acidobacteriota bacterium]MBV9478811.1 DUF1761 domain-containing protein [Acidobacteriota bacterium]